MQHGEAPKYSPTTVTTVVDRTPVSRETLEWGFFSALAQRAIPVCELVNRLRRVAVNSADRTRVRQ